MVTSHQAASIVFSKPDETCDKIKKTNHTTFKELVLGELAVEVDLINTLKQVHSRLGKVN